MTDSLHYFLQCLRRADSSLSAGVGLSPGIEEIADMLWLADRLEGPTDSEEPIDNESDAPEDFGQAETELEPDRSSEVASISNVSETTRQKASDKLFVSSTRSSAKPLMIPAAAALRQPLKLARSLRALARKIESRTQEVIDEEATAIAIAEKNPVGIVSRPAKERWLDLELIVEHSRVAALWEQTSKEFIELLECLGAFRTVRVWTLRTYTDKEGKYEPRLTSGIRESEGKGTRVGKPKELVDSSGRRLVMLLSDCISPLWRQGLIHNWLADWGRNGPMVIIQWFPAAYWARTGLKSGDEVWLSALYPGIPSNRLTRQYIGLNPEEWVELSERTFKTQSFVVPVASLESDDLVNWSRVVAGFGGVQVQGRRFELSLDGVQWRGPAKILRQLPSSGTERVRLFLETASELAKELVRLMSLGPVSPEITNLIQETLLPQSGTVHVAEVFLSGLLEATDFDSYQFVPGVQELLRESAIEVDERLVFRVLSQYISDRYRRTPREFKVFLQKHGDWSDEQWNRIEGFAEIKEQLRSSSNGTDINSLEEVAEIGGQLQGSRSRTAIDNEGMRLWRSKLLLIGEGGVGKTSLLRAIQGKSFDARQSSTHGIEIKALGLAHPTEPDVTMTLNAWDFSGQEIYHATHQFFLTNRSLFLLAFNARLGFEQGKLIHWLKTIRANAPDSPVILVATYTDERDADIPLSDLKQQFPQITGLYEASNKTGEGIRELQQAITTAAAELPLMGEIWPTTWLKFANAIRQSKGKQATPQKFWDAMTKAKVSEDGQPVLAKWLHELGDILFFQDDDDVNDLVILKPQWVTEYISKVLTAKEVIKRNGIFTRQCMNQVWADLSPSLRDFLLHLMERFDLSYRTLENRDISLVVERLPFEPPDGFQSLWQKKQQEPNCKEISMKFQVSEILPGILTWFIARQHRFTIDQGERRGIHWRTGVLFQDRDAKHLGLVRTLRDESTNADYLHLTVRGPVPHNFFDLLREGLELTLRRYPGLKVTRLLPCPDPENTDCIHEFDYANLIRRLELEKPKTRIECPHCLADISVTGILFGLHYTTEDAVIETIDSLQESMTQEFTELRALHQRNTLQFIRGMQKQIESPCPSVFVLRPDDRRIWQKAWEGDIGSQHINLQLYCEHPGCFHPVQHGGLYPIDNPEQWLRVMTPHLNRLSGILKYVTPVVGPWLTISAPVYSELIKNDLALTKALIDKLPEITFADGYLDVHDYPDSDGDLDFDDGNYIALSEFDRALSVSGPALRSLHEFLKRKDPAQTWGNLTRTITPEGDVMWLCKDHIKEIYPTSS